MKSRWRHGFILSLAAIMYWLIPAGSIYAQKAGQLSARDSILHLINTIADPSEKVIRINSYVKDFNDNTPEFDSLLQQAEKISIDNNLIKGQWETLATRGFVLLARGDYQGAQNCYLKAAQLAITNRDSTEYFILQGTIALVNYYMKSYDKSEKYFLETIRFLEKKNDSVELASVYNNLGMVYSAQDRFAEAISQYEKSMQLKIALGRKDYFHILNNMADVYQKMGNLDKAAEISHEFYQESYRIKNPVYMAVANINLGSILSQNQQPNKALPYLLESIRLCKVNSYKTYESEALKELSTCYERLGRFREAYLTSLEAWKLSDSLLTQERVASMQEMGEKFENQKKEEQIKSLQLQKSKDHRIINLQLAVLILAIAGLVLFILVAIQLRKRNRERKIQNLALQELNENKTRFFSIIAHDLRSPFSAFLGMLDLILEEYNEMPPEKVRERLAALNITANTTYSLLQNLLMWASSQMEGIQVKPREVKIPQVISQQLEYLRQPMQDKGIRAELTCDANLEVHSDQEMISFVFRNLLTNAIKYSHPGGSIQITGRSDVDQVAVSFNDRGVGMNQETLSTLLSPGTRKSTPGTNGEKGTGLGLPLCRTFMEKLGGRLAVESIPGIGTTITCVFPV